MPMNSKQPADVRPEVKHFTQALIEGIVSMNEMELNTVNMYQHPLVVHNRELSREGLEHIYALAICAAGEAINEACSMLPPELVQPYLRKLTGAAACI
jgi:hypothetical protein